ncbi:MAG: hypothetical protein ACJ8CN_03080 [Gemmatimonadales bacterium]
MGQPVVAGAQLQRVVAPHQVGRAVERGEQEGLDVRVQPVGEAGLHLLQVQVQGHHVVAGVAVRPRVQLVQEQGELALVVVVPAHVPDGPPVPRLRLVDVQLQPAAPRLPRLGGAPVELLDERLVPVVGVVRGLEGYLVVREVVDVAHGSGRGVKGGDMLPDVPV